MALTVTLAFFAMGAAISPVVADKIVGCSVYPPSPLQMNVGTSAVMKVTITYNLFATSSWPMTVTLNPISAGFTSNSSTFTDTSFGAHTFFLKVTNTDPSVTSGIGTIQVTWAAGSTSLCGTIGLQGTGQPLPCTLNNCFTSPGAFEMVQAGSPVVGVSYSSSEHLSDTGSAYLTVTNHAGQTVIIQQLTTVFTPLGTKSFSFTLPGLASGSYFASSFVTNSQGVVLSVVYSVAFTV